MKRKYYSSRRRIQKAYWTTFIITLSYLRLNWVSKVLGKRYYQRKVEKLNIKNANRAKATILELEGLFVKVGQLLSILTNFLPEAYHEPLNSLQNQLPPRPYADIEKRIQAAFNAPIDELFTEFDKKPLATASIGQVHRAKLMDGTDVIVKVQHFNIEKIAEVDLKIIKRLTQLASYYFDIKGLEYAYEQIKAMIEDELDFAKEAESMTIIRENLADMPGVMIPNLQSAYSSKRVLTTSFCEGVKVSDLQQLDEWGVDKRDVAQRLIAIFVEMVLRNGFYHADPHPGNILIQQDGTIVLLDFGATAQVQPALRRGIPKLLEAVIKNDTEGTLDALKSMDFIADTKDATRIAEKLIKAFRFFVEEEIKMKNLDFKKLQNVNPFDTSLFKLQTELGLKTLANTVQVPKDYVLLNRTATLLLGICSALDSSLNPLEEVQPHLEGLLKEERGDIANYIFKSLRGTAMNTLAIPENLNTVLQQVKKGQVELNISGTNERTRMVYLISRQVTFMLLGIGALILAFWLEANGQKWVNYSFLGSGIFFFMMWRTMREAKRLYISLKD